MSTGLKEEAAKQQTVQRYWVTRWLEVKVADAWDYLPGTDGQEGKRAREYQEQEDKDLANQELDKLFLDKGQAALEKELDKLLLNKDQDALEKVLENKNSNESPKLLEHCVRKMLASDAGKKALASKTHVSGWALKAMRDPKLAVDLLSSINVSALSGAEFGEYVKSLGNDKDDILAEALLAVSKKPLPTDNTAKQKATKEQAMGFAGMASAMDPAKFAELAKKMLESEEGKQVLVANPKLGGALLSTVDPDALKDFDFKAFGDAKDEILGEALLRLSQKTAMTEDGIQKPPASLDPKLFTLLATKVDAKVWNEKTATTGVRKGMGARIGMELWNAGGYEQVVELIKHGVDTSLSTRVTEDVKGDREGFYSGFVQPTQHIVSKYLREIDDPEKAKKNAYEKRLAAVTPRVDELALKNPTAGTGWKKELDAAIKLASEGDYLEAHAGLKKLSAALKTAGASGVTKEEKQKQTEFEALLNTLPEATPKSKIEGAKKIFAALEAKDKKDKENKVESTLRTVTKWSDVQNSDWMNAFKEKPGTIWGFEDVRMPYVQAGHDTDKGSRPLRMWELWDALSPNRDTYSKLLANPEKFADEKVKEAAKTIRSMASTRMDYNDIKDLDAFVKEFEKEAKAVLLEFAAQLPKGTFADVANESGFLEGKFLGGLACKAGLWWAKEQKEPVYYCLDGINMDDVTNHKKMKNAEIDDFLAGRSKKRHDEVITMVEIREVLKNWDDLKFKNDKDQDEDVVKFVYKGKILSGDDLKEKINKWKEDMEKVNKANPTPAPDYKTFTNQLNKIDPGLLATLGKEKDTKKANKDARDIVKKYGYLIKIANTKPHIAIKYIMLKCEMLSSPYGLISEDLPEAATALKDAFDEKDDKKIKTAAQGLRSEILKCHKDFQAPLESALLRDPVTLKPI